MPLINEMDTGCSCGDSNPFQAKKKHNLDTNVRKEISLLDFDPRYRILPWYKVAVRIMAKLN